MGVDENLNKNFKFSSKKHISKSDSSIFPSFFDNSFLHQASFQS